MNEKLKEYIDNIKSAKRKDFAKELVDEGVYNKVYAPIKFVGYGHRNDDTTVKLKVTLKDRNTKVGDTMNISFKGDKVSITIDEIEIVQNGAGKEYPFHEYNAELGCEHYFKKEPVEITDEEYDELKKYVVSDPDKNDSSNKEAHSNRLAMIIGFVAVIEYICGFFAGIIIASDDIALMIATWVACAVSGTVTLSLAEVIQLLQDIKDK